MALQPHMIKPFDNCKDLDFVRPGVAGGMFSEEGEYLKLHEVIVCERTVENWLKKVDFMVQKTLLRPSKKAAYFYAYEAATRGFSSSMVWSLF